MVVYPLLKKSRHSTLLLTCLCLLLLLPLTLCGQRRNDSLLRRAIILGHSTPTTTTANTPTQRLSRQSIERMGISSLSDALRRFSGVNLRDYGGIGGLKTISIRGLGATHTTVSYDGLPVQNSQSGEIDLSRFILDEISSIGLHIADHQKLLLPPRSCSAAMVELDTFSPHHSPRHLHGHFSLSQGSFGLWSAHESLLYSPDSLQNFSLDTHYLHARNNYPFTVENGRLTHREKRQNNQVNDWISEGNYRLKTNHHQLRAKLYGHCSNRYLPGAVKLYNNQNYEHLSDKQIFGQVQWEHFSSEWKTSMAAKYSDDRTHYLNLDKSYPQGKLSQRYTNKSLYLTAGIAHESTQLQWALSTDYSYDNMQAFLPTPIAVNRHLWLTMLSGRWLWERGNITARLTSHYAEQRHSSLNTKQSPLFKLTPSVSANYQLIGNENLEWNCRAHWQNYFRLPTFVENYYFNYGNPHLLPESSQQFGIGTTLTWRSLQKFSLTLSADAYYNRLKNKIVGLPVSLFIWRTFNVSAVPIQGLDLTLHGKYKLNKHQSLYADFNYSYLNATSRQREHASSYGKQIAYSPHHSGALSLAWYNPWVNICFSASGASKRWPNNEHYPGTQMSGYIECGLSLHRRFGTRKGQVLIQAEGINIFNQRYAIIHLYPMPGRSYQLTLGYEF